MRIVEFEYAIGDEARVEAIADRVETYCGDDEPYHSGSFFAACQRDQCESVRTQRCDAQPDEKADRFHASDIYVVLGDDAKREVRPCASLAIVALRKRKSRGEKTRRAGHFAAAGEQLGATIASRMRR